MYECPWSLFSAIVNSQIFFHNACLHSETIIYLTCNHAMQGKLLGISIMILLPKFKTDMLLCEQFLSFKWQKLTE